MDFKKGDRVIFPKGRYGKSEKATILDVDYVGGIPWYKMKFDKDKGLIRGGQYEGEFKPIKVRASNRAGVHGIKPIKKRGGKLRKKR